MHDGVIHSHARMTYTAVNAILTDRDPRGDRALPPLVPMFERMHELFEILNARRRRRGSIDFDLPESEIVLDDAGLVEAIVAAERNVAHRLIEEFMLLANETVAAHLETHGVPSLYRVHEDARPGEGRACSRSSSRRSATRCGAPANELRAAALPEAGREDSTASRKRSRSRS